MAENVEIMSVRIADLDFKPSRISESVEEMIAKGTGKSGEWARGEGRERVDREGKGTEVGRERRREGTERDRKGRETIRAIETYVYHPPKMKN
eukprot:1394073-Amorphochlora_amoeboformis.AAC.2